MTCHIYFDTNVCHKDYAFLISDLHRTKGPRGHGRRVVSSISMGKRLYGIPDEDGTPVERGVGAGRHCLTHISDTGKELVTDIKQTKTKLQLYLI